MGLICAKHHKTSHQPTTYLHAHDVIVVGNLGACLPRDRQPRSGEPVRGHIVHLGRNTFSPHSNVSGVHLPPYVKEIEREKKGKIERERKIQKLNSWSIEKFRIQKWWKTKWNKFIIQNFKSSIVAKRKTARENSCIARVTQKCPINLPNDQGILLYPTATVCAGKRTEK